MNELRDVTPKRKDLSMPRRRRMRRRSIALALAAATALTCAGVPGFAQQAPPTTGGGLAAPAATQPATTQGAATRPANANGHITTQPGGGMLLNFKEASIDSVLDELSTAAGFIVIKEVQRLEGRVTLVSKQPVKPDEAVPLLNSVLKNAGYAAIQQGRVLKILQRDKAKRANIPVRVGSDPTKIPDTDELITQVIPLKSADAQQLRQDLTPLIDTSTADFTSNASSNSLVITDTSANIRRVAMIVSAMDSSIIDNATVKVMQLQHAAAATAAKLILEVFGEQANPQQGGNRGGNPFRQFFGGGGPFGGGGGGADGGGRGGGRGDGAGGAAARRATPRVTASSDDRTNTLIVSGPTDTIAVIERVVKELDADPAAEETVFIYRLKNAQALNVESVMNSLFNGTTSGNRGSSTLNAGTNRTSSIQRGGSGRGGSSGGLGGSGSSFGGRGGGLQATGGGFNGGGGGVNRGGGGFGGGGFGLSSNASRTAADLSGQVTIIADPDTNSMLIRTKPGNYERVKAVLAELDRAVGQVLIKVLVAEVTHDNSTDIGAEFSVLNLRPSGNGQKGGTNFGLARLQSGLVAQILEDNFTATIRALENVGKLDVLSRPYILASDNQLASITVGQEIPFITNSRITDTGQTINSVEYDDIGILLDVIPHINEDGLVILDVAPEISALTGTQIPISDTVSSPVIAKRSAQTRIAIQDGQTVVIGGLMEDRKTETIDKVPFLGDIPIAGELFKRTQNKKTKTELLIFLTPHVAAQPTQLKEMSRQEIQGSKLVPRAVDPNAFEEHRQGLELGQPNPPADGTAPDAPKPDAPKKEPRQ